MHRYRKVFVQTAGWLTLLLGCGWQPACAQFAFIEGFEGPEPAWIDAGSDAQYRLELRERTPVAPHSGDGCEHMRLLAGNGTYVHVALEVGNAPVIDEFHAAVWIRADRPGAQLLVRTVLPRAVDPTTGKPLVALLEGTGYRATGRWEQLRLEDAPRLLERAARQLRHQYGADIDTRQAYVDQAWLNIYSGPGRTNVWIDDLEIGGVPNPVPWTTVASARSSEATEALRGGATAAPSSRRVEFRGKVLLVDGSPFFPRMVEHQGEPLARLKGLGLNAVKLAEPPTPELLIEAAQAGIWLVAPPPAWAAIEDSGLPADQSVIGPQYDPVLAWHLGDHLAEPQLAATRQRAKAVRRADRHAERPLVCGADADVHRYSRTVDVILLDRRPIGANIELSEYATWLRGRARLMAPGRPVWVTVQTQGGAPLLGQRALLAGQEPPGASVSSEQIRLLCYQALAGGARGICYQSHTQLSGESAAEQTRSWSVELLNLELELIESWAAGGNLLTTVDTDHAEIRAAVIGTERAHLLLPIWCSPAAQYVPGQSAGNQISLKIPGIPSSYDVYELTPSSLRPLRHQRVTGGMRIVLDELGLTSTVLLTGDPLVVNSLRGRSARVAARSAQLARDLAAEKLDATRRVLGQIATSIQPPEQAQEWLATAAGHLEQCDRRLAAADHRTAYTEARRALRPLRLLERAVWDQAIATWGPGDTNPLAAAYATLPQFVRLAQLLRSASPGPNQLPAGELENLETMLGAGWRHVALPTEQFNTTAELSPRAAHSGQFGLRMMVAAADREQPAILVESPPVWIESAPVRVQQGQWLLFQGWVKVPRPITGSVDGLLIIDSPGGREMAQSIQQTRDWQPFKFYRVAAETGDVTVSFGLSGIGEAWIDDVQIQILGPREASPALEARHSGRIAPLPPVR